MPVPSGTPALFLGRALFDRKKFRPDTDPAVIECLSLMAQTFMGAGWPSPAKTGDATTKMAVYAESDGMGAHLLWGGNPADPLNPTSIIVSASGSATVNWQEEGALVVSAGTVNFVGSAVTVTDVAGVATVTITSGSGTVTEAFKTISVSGQSDIVADLAADTLTVAAGTGIVVTTTAGTDTLTFAINTSTVAQNSFTTIAVSGQSNVVADSPTDTLTLIAGTNIVITTSAAGDSVTITSSDTTYTAGAGINLSSTKFVADPHNDSHVGLVDPTTGDDSSADDAQIGILWHEIANYDVAENMLVGHAASDSSKPVVEYKTVEDWLKTLPGYDTHRVLVSNETGDVEWYTINEMLDMLTGRDDTADQSIGADAGGSPAWQDDDDTCP